MRRDICERIKTALKKLSSSRDVNFTEISVKWDKRRSFSVECMRMEGDVADEDGNVVYERTGRPVEFQVYYRVNGADVDCCTLSLWLDERDYRDLKEFVDMYR